MTKKRNILITAALPYANGPIHLGHLVGYIQADIWHRYHKMRGNTSYYICGDDAHGTPIMLRAQREGISPEELIQRMAKEHLNDFTTFNVQFDHYHSTHSDENRELVSTLYHKLVESGDITQRTIKQAFDPVEGIFLPDRFIKGTCPKCGAEDQYGDNCEVCGATYTPAEVINPVSSISGATPIEKESLHFFFQLENYRDVLEEWLKGNHLNESVANKLKEWFADGLQDWDISRDAPYFGFEIPGQRDKYFYVWLDAPIGYMASFKAFCQQNKNIDFDDYWQPGHDTELYHFIGKDIIYFHSLFWPAILHSAGYRKPTAIFANGFLTVNGQKMSKSRGTFITAQAYSSHLNPEYLRYYYAAKLNSHFEDFDLNFTDFAQRINSDLVGKVVNIASRCAGFIHKKFSSKLSIQCADPTLWQTFIDKGDEISHCYEEREFSRAMRHITELADLANRYIDEKKPWQLVKSMENLSDVHDICSLGLNLFRVIMTYLKPVLPTMAEKVENFLNIAEMTWDNRTELLTDHVIHPFKPLMQRIEQDKVEAMLETTQEDNNETKTDKESPSANSPLARNPISPEISFEDFAKVDLRIAKIISAEHVDGADKLLKLQLDLNGETKQVFAGIKSAYDPEQLIGQLTVIVANLAPRKMRFGISEGMVILAGGDKGLYLISPQEGAEAGMRVQ